MRAASKTVKRHGFIRRNFHLNIDGFTIVETLIVLAVTGLLFVIAAVQVTGRQNETEFQQAINDVGPSFQQIINQTTTGNYTSPNNITCDGTGSAPAISPYTGPDSGSEGTSNACVFTGKVVQFASAAAVDPQQYIVYPVAALRVDKTTGLDCQTITCQNPVIIAPDSGTSVVPDDGDAHYLLNGLTLKSATYVNGATSISVGAIGIMTSLGGTPGSQHFYLVPLIGTNMNMNPKNTANYYTHIGAINGSLIGSYTTIQTALTSGSGIYQIQLCFQSATTNQSGRITIGGNGGDLNSVQTTLYNTTDCT